MDIRKVIGLMLVLGLLAAPAMAADTGGEEEEAMLLETVTVTATKREGTVKEFPGNLSVMDEVFIESRGINTLGDLARFTPNLYIKDTSSGGSIVCRGVSTIDTSLFSPMGLYVDDVAYPMGYMSNQDLFDVERVEVLRGPQATLYGRNSESGVVSIRLKEPGNEQRNRLLTELGNFGTVRLGGSSSGPIYEDSLFYSVALQGYMTDGFIKNVYKGEDDVAGEETVNGRGSLRWVPNENWDVTLNLDGANRNLGISALRLEEGPKATGRNEVSVNGADRAHEKELGQSARIKYRWQSVELTSITSHRIFDRVHTYDFDRTAVALGYSELDAEMDTWSQEFRLTSRGENRLSWLLGFYGRHEDIDAGIDFNHVNPLMAKTRDGSSEDNGYAGFGQATYEIVDGLRLTGGLRLDVSESSGEQTYTSSGGTVSYDRDIDETAWLPMASLAYDFTPHVTAYATYSRGFLAGGYNFYSATTADNFGYDAEYTTNYELGVKTNWLGNSLNVNATVFYMDIADKQVREEVTGGGAGVWKFSNAAQAHTQGVELESTYRPIPELQLSAGFGYADSVVDEWETTVSGTAVDYGGNKLPWAPKFTYNIGAQYTHQSGFFASADLLGTGEQYFDAANDLSGDGYQTVNLRLGLQGEEAELSLWCKNVFDAAYAVKKVDNSAGLTMVEDGAPRTLGLSFNWRF